jgi:hypothetical protein
VSTRFASFLCEISAIFLSKLANSLVWLEQSNRHRRALAALRASAGTQD